MSTVFTIPAAALEPKRTCGVKHCAAPEHFQTPHLFAFRNGNLYVDGKRWEG